MRNACLPPLDDSGPVSCVARAQAELDEALRALTVIERVVCQRTVAQHEEAPLQRRDVLPALEQPSRGVFALARDLFQVEIRGARTTPHAAADARVEPARHRISLPTLLTHTHDDDAGAAAGAAAPPRALRERRAWSPAHLRAAPRARSRRARRPIRSRTRGSTRPRPTASASRVRERGRRAPPAARRASRGARGAVATTDDPASTDEKNGEWGDNPTGGGRDAAAPGCSRRSRARGTRGPPRSRPPPPPPSLVRSTKSRAPTPTPARARRAALGAASRCARWHRARARPRRVAAQLARARRAPRLRSTQPSGTIVVYKLLFGSLEHCSLRSDRGRVGRAPASARRVASPAAWTLLGGPPREFAAQGVPALIPKSRCAHRGPRSA